MLSQLRDFVVDNGWVDLALLPFFSMVDRRKSLHQDVIAGTRQQFPDILATEVPYSSEIERMSLRRAPLPSYSPRSVVAQIYSALWTEIETRMERRPLAAAATLASSPVISSAAEMSTTRLNPPLSQ
jgi:cellulose biosynthesis protein BcsQ